MNNAITYFGAFDVIKNILFGSKNLNIVYFRIVLVRKIYLIKNVEGDKKKLISILDQNIIYNKKTL